MLDVHSSEASEACSYVALYLVYYFCVTVSDIEITAKQKINIRYIYYALRFDCTRQSSSAAISKQTKLSELHWNNFNFSTAFALCNPNGNFDPRGVQVFCMFSMMASQIGSISYPICRFARSVRLIFLISIPSIISLFQ